MSYNDIYSKNILWRGLYDENFVSVVGTIFITSLIETFCYIIFVGYGNFICIEYRGYVDLSFVFPMACLRK